jgi:isovaleryl-CoA dehydrogenase
LQTDPNAAKPSHGVTAFLIERGMEGFSSSPKVCRLAL